MSASKTNFFLGIVSLLKEMSKTFTDLSNRVEKTEAQMVEMKKLEAQMVIIAKPHLQLMSNVSKISTLQQDIAKQIVQQHEEVQALYLALGLKKDLSYYSFDISNMEEH